MRIAVTTGEPAGIGPEISVAALDALAPDVAITLIGDRDLLALHGVPAGVAIEPVALAVRASPGQLDARNARYVLATLDRAIRGCLSGEFDAVVTAPVHKGVINDAGVAFTGHNRVPGGTRRNATRSHDACGRGCLGTTARRARDDPPAAC